MYYSNEPRAISYERDDVKNGELASIKMTVNYDQYYLNVCNKKYCTAATGPYLCAFKLSLLFFLSLRVLTDL